MTIDNYKNRLKEVEDDVSSLQKLNQSLKTEKLDLQKKVMQQDGTSGAVDQTKANNIDFLGGDNEIVGNNGL